MRKLIILILLSLVVTSAYALVETAENGPQQVTACWIKGTATIEPGSLVALVTGDSVTFPGRTVTGTNSTLGITNIYGVTKNADTVTGGTTSLESGMWIDVQTHGYVKVVKLTGEPSIQDTWSSTFPPAGGAILPSSTSFEGQYVTGSTAFNSTTGNIVIFSKGTIGAGLTDAWIGGI